MTPEVQAALARIRAGQGGPADMAVLQRALLGLAPSSPDAVEIAGALAGGRVAPAAFPGEPSRMPSAVGPVGGDKGLWDLTGGVGSRRQPPAVSGDQGLWDLTGGAGSVGTRPAPGQVGYSPDFGPLFPADAGTGLSGVEKSVYDMQKTQAEGGGGGNQLNTDVQGESFQDNPFFQAGSHNIDITNMPDNYADVSENYMGLPQGYSFSGMTPTGLLNTYNNPSAYLNQYAESKGGGRNMAGFLEAPYNAALALSSSGVIGQSTRPDLGGGGGKSQATQLQDIEEFLNAYDTPGQMVDPRAIYNQMMQRASETDFGAMTSPETGLAISVPEIIDMTNKAAMTSAYFLPAGGQDWMNGILQAAGQEYLLRTAQGEIDPDLVSYPAFLRDEKGLGDIFG